MVTPRDQPLIVLVGPTASGKTSLALRLAEEFNGEIVSCDSVAVYRELEIGTAKPTREERALIQHHMIDIVSPDEACTAGDYSRQAREALTAITKRGHLPIVAGLLTRLDATAAAAIHINDVPKVIRAVEVSLAAGGPLTQQWQKGRDFLTGYRILRLGLNPTRERLYERINQRAAAMFDRGLIEETERLIARYGPDCRPLTSLGYAEATAVLQNELTREQAVVQAQQGHRNYAKRQLTWFRREPSLHWFQGCGGDDDITGQALQLVTAHFEGT
jgi:tRNA dimethylallyltransferase